MERIMAKCECNNDERGERGEDRITMGKGKGETRDQERGPVVCVWYVCGMCEESHLLLSSLLLVRIEFANPEQDGGHGWGKEKKGRRVEQGGEHR